MYALISFWGYALAAAAFATLLSWRVIEPSRQPVQRVLLAAFAMTACWAWLSAIEPGGFLARSAETARNLTWVAFLYSISVSADERQRGVRLVYAAVALVIGLQFVAVALLASNPSRAILETSHILRLATAAGALVLVHNVYGQAAPASRRQLRFGMLALALTWIYDLNYFTVRLLETAAADPLYEWRGIAVALTAPLFALTIRSDENWRLKLSRAATFQSISLLGISAYFILMAILATALRGSSLDWASSLAVTVLAVMTVALLAVLPSRRARGWVQVKLAKHLFEHRYDYRSEWLRFVDTIGRSDTEDSPLGERVIKAFADMVDSPGGLLLANDGGQISIAAEWNWPGPEPDATALGDGTRFWDSVEQLGRIVELSALRRGLGHALDKAIPVPGWMIDDDRAWAAIPLSHHERLVGIVLLSPPDFQRMLDWEDFDLLRTAGRQAASAIAEAHGQDALADARRFDEFNRRFAFILHDVKNLVSQLSLVARNAERHAGNPEFRADMVATLKSSVGKMNDLLTRLSPHAQTRVHDPAAQPLRPILDKQVTGRSASHPIRLAGDLDCWVLADRQALDQAIGHLVQNACEASPAERPVRVTVEVHGEWIAISVIDDGIGMDSDFIRNRLFQPFTSTKDNGFGIGAFEARSLVQAMGGRLEVHSRPGKGSRFTIILPAAEPVLQERKRA